MAFLKLVLVWVLLSLALGKRLVTRDESVSAKPVRELRRLAQKQFGLRSGAPFSARFERKGAESLLEQAFGYWEVRTDWRAKHAWKMSWGRNFTVKLLLGEDAEMESREWLQMVLQSVVMDENSETGLMCLKFGECNKRAGLPQYLLEALPSGDLIPILSFKRNSEDRSWVQWTSKDFGAFSEGCGIEKLQALQRFNFLGQFMARAYVISDLSYAPASFHPVIYDSLMAGHAVPPAPDANAYQEVDLIPECEWLAGIYGGRRPDELETYAWQSCNEIRGPIPRYFDENCHKPTYRSQEMWTERRPTWGNVAPEGTRADDLVPFERAKEYTQLKCTSKWEQDFKAPVNELVKGFRQVISDESFWKEVDSKTLKQLVEGDANIDAHQLVENVEFTTNWKEDQKQLVLKTLHSLGHGTERVPSFQKTLNKMFRHFTGSYKAPPVGNFPRLTFVLMRNETMPHGNDTNASVACKHIYVEKGPRKIFINEACLENDELLTSLQTIENPVQGPIQKLELTYILRSVAYYTFARNSIFSAKINLNRTGADSIFEQTRSIFQQSPDTWASEWERSALSVKFVGEAGVDAGGLRKEWYGLMLETIVKPKGHRPKGLQCVKSGECSAETPQYLLEELPSGDLIPLLSFERDADPVGSKWMSGDFAAFAEVGLQIFETLERFNFLGQWMARAYVISFAWGYSPASLHPVFYESLMAGHPVVPEPMPNAYQEKDSIQECEWLAAVYYSRRPQELGSYGWQKCDEVKDPESGRYTQDGCYKPLYRSQEMWEYLYNEWGPVAPEGSKADDLVPFERAEEYTKLKCKNKWERDFEAPVAAFVRGFRTVIPHRNFWRLADSQALKRLVEGDPEVNVDHMINDGTFSGNWTEDEKKVFADTLHELQEKNRGIAPFENTINKLLRFCTGSFKEPVGGFQKKLYFEVYEMNGDVQRCAPLVGKTCFNKLRIPRGCLTSVATLQDQIKESVANEAFGFG